MSKSLAEYAAQHPVERPQTEAAARSYHDRQAELEKAEDLKQSIAERLQQGHAPESILYTALTLIGILTADKEWEAECKSFLDGIYSDLTQQSLFVDTAAAAAKRLETMNKAYTDKTRAQLQRSLNGCRRLSDALKDALQAIDGIAQSGEQTTENGDLL